MFKKADKCCSALFCFDNFPVIVEVQSCYNQMMPYKVALVSDVMWNFLCFSVILCHAIGFFFLSEKSVLVGTVNIALTLLFFFFFYKPKALRCE